MNDSCIYIFDPQSPETNNFQSRFSIGLNELVIDQAEIDIGNGELLTIDCRITTDNLAYSFALKNNGEHQFTIMGFMRSIDSPDPTIMYTSKDGRDFQISVNI